jgi:NMD protein affecting ribosome stability and mRNA decay
MALARCARCGKLYEKIRSAICPACQPVEDEDYEKIRKALEEKPGQSAEDLAEATGVDIECVLRLLSEGRIETAAANLGVKCGRCGAPAISLSKKLCEACLRKLNAELAIQQSKVKLPSKKQTALGSGLKTFDSTENDPGTHGGTKYNR